MSSPFIGEIRSFGFNFPPRGWATCSGQLLSIASNTALFSLLGTQYGGNGIQTFGLPDLRGRVAINQGQGPGLPNYVIGEMAGSPTTTLLTTNMPAHTHVVTGSAAQPCNSGAGPADNPTGAIPAGSASHEDFAAAASATGAMAPAPVTATAQPAGGGQPFDNMPPYLVVNMCIATTGIFPSRN
jgi:microcystin-dependent protein